MNSDQLKLENKEIDLIYRKNKIKSIIFLLALFVFLIITIIISLWAGSYGTTFKDIMQGVLNQASDNRINIVVRNVRLPRIFTAIIAGAGFQTPMK